MNNPKKRLRPASRQSRLLAFLLDILLIGAFVLMVLNKFIIPSQYAAQMKEFEVLVDEYTTQEKTFDAKAMENLNPQLKEMIQFMQAFTLFSLWAYFTLCEAITGGSSLGKSVFSIRVVNTETFEYPGIFDSFLRAGLKTLAILAMFPVFMISYFMALFMENHRAGHDFLTRTVVVEDY